MKNIFVIITEHHIAMALAIIHQYKLENNVILFSSQIKGAYNESFFREIMSSEINFNTKFISVVDNLPTKLIFYKTLWKRIFFRRVYQKIRDTLCDIGPESKFFVFADHDPVTQFVINEYSEHDFHLVQDGLTQYAVLEQTNRSAKSKQGYYKWMFGDFWKPIRFFGDYYNYSSLYVLYPEMVESRYKKFKLNKVNIENFYNPVWIEFSKKFVLKYFPQFFELKADDAVMFLPRLRNKKEVRFVEGELSSFCKKHKIKRICLKNHPRSPFTLNKVGYVESFAVPGCLPAECLFAFNSKVEVKYYVSLSALVLVGPFMASKERVNILFGHKLAVTKLKIRENEPLFAFLDEKTTFHDELN